MKELTIQNFDQNISSGLILVDFWAERCGPCRMLSPVLEGLSQKIEGVQFSKVNIDEEQELASRYGIMSIPTVMIFKDGQLVDKVIWLNPENVYQSKLEDLK